MEEIDTLRPKPEVHCIKSAPMKEEGKSLVPEHETLCSEAVLIVH